VQHLLRAPVDAVNRVQTRQSFERDVHGVVPGPLRDSIPVRSEPITTRLSLVVSVRFPRSAHRSYRDGLQAGGRGFEPRSAHSGPPCVQPSTDGYCRFESTFEYCTETVFPSTFTATITMMAMNAMSRMYSTRFAPASPRPELERRFEAHARQ
jgi:hypothetical protein